MRTPHAPFSLEGTLEIIDLSHASEEDALRTVLQELRARREGRPRRANGEAFVVEFGHAPGPRGARPHEPSAPRGTPAGAEAGDGSTQPRSFANFGELLRYAAEVAAASAGEPEEAPEGSGPPHGPATPADCAERTIHVEEHGAMEQFLAQRTVIIDDDGGGKTVAAAVVGFGLGAAAMYLARHLRHAPPPSVRRDRPRRPYRAPEAPWRGPLDDLPFGFGDPAGDEQDDEEASPDAE